MRVLIRTDASPAIGTGHAMRCLTLANELKSRGAQTCFISRHLPDYLGRMFQEQGHKVIQLKDSQPGTKLDELAHSAWLGVSQEQDAADVLQAVQEVNWDWLIVDHYALDFRWESRVRQVAKKVLAIDDIADRRHDCDILLDQNFYADMESRYRGKVPAHCELLLGPRYALLRAEFRSMHEQIRPRTGNVRSILIFFGGMDAGNFTGRAIAALAEIDLRGIRVDVVIGAQHPNRQQIEMECAGRGYACHVQTDRMAELMAAADMAVGAGGIAVWERCCLGLPTLAIGTAENQERQLADAAEAGLVYTPDGRGELERVIAQHVDALLSNAHLRALLSANGIRMVTGRGANDVAILMGCGDVRVRVANMDDVGRLFAWRNHPSVRAVSRNSEEIGWEAHQRWMAKVLSEPRNALLIGEQSGVPFGVVRFDIGNEDDAEISIYLDPEKQSSGLGQGLLSTAEIWLRAHQPEISVIRAVVLGGNERSQRFFERAGYKAESTTYLKRLH